MGTINSETSKCNKIRTTLLAKSVALEMSDLKAWEVHVSNLNPLVNTFVPQWIPSMQADAIGFTVFILNPDAESFLPHFDLNPRATVFSPKCKTNMENGVIGTLLFIIVILSILIVRDVITCMQMANDICPIVCLRKLKLDNPNKIVIGHLNINSIRQKFVSLKEIIDDNIDIFLVSETKLDGTFPIGQFSMNRYPFREDRNDKGGGSILFIRDHLPCRRINVNFNPNIFIEINLNKENGYLLAYIILLGT